MLSSSLIFYKQDIVILEVDGCTYEELHVDEFKPLLESLIKKYDACKVVKRVFYHNYSKGEDILLYFND